MSSPPIIAEIDGLDGEKQDSINQTNVSETKEGFSSHQTAICPVCLLTIKEAFVTRCGHSFCYNCIVQALQVKQNCPTCSLPLNRWEIFPNFLGNRLIQESIEATKSGSLPNAPPISPSDVRSVIANNNSLGIDEVNDLLKVLIKRKQSLEAVEKRDQYEILLDFLKRARLQKSEALKRLEYEKTCFEQDISTVERRLEELDETRNAVDELAGSSMSVPEKRPLEDSSPKKSESLSAKKRRITEHFDDLHDRYFDIRSEKNSRDPLSSFMQNLGKFSRYSSFNTLAILSHADIFNNSSIVSSMTFDRDEEYFATAGVTKKVKIFDFNAVLNHPEEARYPIQDFSCRSKISCVSWNSYLKSQIASSDYEGLVTVWDASTAKKTMVFEEHEKRIWSVDFSCTDPTRLASGSDDAKVKIWSTNQVASVGTISAKANVCCVKFNPIRPHSLVFGSADHFVYLYDLRMTRSAVKKFEGHRKAVSYVKFMSANEAVSASTDSTLRLWDIDSGSCKQIFSGHVNEKNFVGLACNSDYVLCGSENNSLYAYYKSFSKPALSQRFGSANPITGEQTQDDGNQFVSSVCLKSNSNLLLAANSQGMVKLMEMIE